MKKMASIVLVALLTSLLVSCSQVPITGRSRLNFIPDTDINEMAAQSYQQFISDNKAKVQSDSPEARLVWQVGSNIQKAVEDYMSANNLYHEIAGFDWQFNLIEQDEVNAWAMPGGKVVVYSGILPYTQDEHGLAVVMGHEIAHVIAKHGAEQMSQELLLQASGTIIQEYGASEVFLQAFSIGSTYGFKLPYSRKHEYEADELGLIFMTLAGYDPHQAPAFWERMSSSAGAGVPEFLSTHPLDEKRIERLNSLLPQMQQYKPR